MNASLISLKFRPSKLVLAMGLAVMPFLISCSQSDADKVADAQYCLDRATPGNGLACLEKIDGLSSSSAETVRCSAYFVDQGFSDVSRLVDIYNQIENDDGNAGDSTIAALSVMAFTYKNYTMAQNFEFAETAFKSCVNSKSAGLVYLSSITRIATATLNSVSNLYDPTTGVLPTETEIKAALCAPGGPPAETVVIIGSAAQIAYDMNCKNKTEPDPVCQQYAAAVSAGTTAEEIGTQLATDLCTP